MSPKRAVARPGSAKEYLAQIHCALEAWKHIAPVSPLQTLTVLLAVQDSQLRKKLPTYSGQDEFINKANNLLKFK